VRGRRPQSNRVYTDINVRGATKDRSLSSNYIGWLGSARDPLFADERRFMNVRRKEPAEERMRQDQAPAKAPGTNGGGSYRLDLERAISDSPP